MQKQMSLYENYGKFFSPRQDVLLINMSAGHEQDVYESASGTIVNTNKDIIEIQTTYPTRLHTGLSKQVCKIATRLFGMGLQICGTVVGNRQNNTLTIRMDSILEAFSPHQMPRTDTTIRLFHSTRDQPVSLVQNGLKQFMEQYQNSQIKPLDFTESPVNLSMGGIRFAVKPDAKISTLSFCAIDLRDDPRPVFAIAEKVWNNHKDGALVCGYRFVNILKADQKRINRHVAANQNSRRNRDKNEKPDWMLTWRMAHHKIVRELLRNA